jgi:hypothetical protein
MNRRRFSMNNTLIYPFRFFFAFALFEFALSDTFTVREIYQDNPIAGETNRLYVRISYDVPISGGSTITIANLANANAISARLLSTMSPLKSGDISAAPLLSCSGSPFSGCWTQGATPLQTSLTMTVATGAVNLCLETTQQAFDLSESPHLRTRRWKEPTLTYVFQVLLANNVYSFFFSVTNSDATLNPPIWYLPPVHLHVSPAFYC